MSNVYTLEPQTNAKVILHTTAGDVEIELWGKETPQASRNFLQLCMEGYYDNTIFHRSVPHFILQGGDPTGTGHGGESIYDQGFPNEYHSRLRFIRRGLVGMANTGSTDTNGSQFFITLDRTEELTRKHTLFGRVAGDTIFNVMTMSEMEVDENERPLYPPRIKSTEIVLNPFDDIIPRISEREKMVSKAIEAQKNEHLSAMKKRKKEKKQLNLLSFGEEANEFEPTAELAEFKKKSSYDFMPVAVDANKEKKSKKEMRAELQERIKQVLAADGDSAPEPDSAPAPAPAPITEPVAVPEEKKEQRKEKRESKEDTKKKKKELKKTDDAPESYRLARNATEASFLPTVPVASIETKPTPRPTQSRQDQIEALKQDIRRIHQYEEEDDKSTKKKKASLIEMEREKYLARGAAFKGGMKGRRTMKGEDDTLVKLLAFQKKLSLVGPLAMEVKKEEPPCALHSVPGCESCRKQEEIVALAAIEAAKTDEGWMAHQLVFAKDKKGKDLMQRKETVDDYVVIDPRERGAKAAEEEYLRKKTFRTNSTNNSLNENNKREREDTENSQRKSRH
ncbi:hypothetical protein BDF14DRAFT_1869805 [Spinellus fusiger]|nr:hypothetical protein BDF14DRAFT_1869805 [Spinellus fusiger]